MVSSGSAACAAVARASAVAAPERRLAKRVMMAPSSSGGAFPGNRPLGVAGGYARSGPSHKPETNLRGGEGGMAPAGGGMAGVRHRLAPMPELFPQPSLSSP